MNPVCHKSINAIRAASYLFQGEFTDSLVWYGLEFRNVDYEAVLDRTGPITLRTVVFDNKHGRFSVDPLGEQAFVQTVHGEDAEQIVDILAWSAMRPQRYGTFLCYAGLLGADAVLNLASYVEAPCPIWATPLAWLQSSLRGAVVLNAELAAPVLARAPGPFQCEDEAHARWLVESGAIAVEKLMVPARSAA